MLFSIKIFLGFSNLAGKQNISFIFSVIPKKKKTMLRMMEKYKG